MLYINCKYSYMKSVISCKCDTVIITHFRRRFIVAKCNVKQPCYKYEVANLFPKWPEKRRCYLLYVAFFRRCINVVGFAKRNSSQNCSFFNFFFIFYINKNLHPIVVLLTSIRYGFGNWRSHSKNGFKTNINRLTA